MIKQATLVLLVLGAPSCVTQRRSDDTEVGWPEVAAVDPTDARRAVARVGPTSGQRRRPRRNFTILRHAIDSANSAEKTLIHA